MIVLFSLRHASTLISHKFNAKQIFEKTKLFTANLLTIAELGWPEVSAWAGVYERFLGPLLEAVFDPNREPDEYFGPSQDTELARFLYPRSTPLEKLRFDRQKQAEFTDIHLGMFFDDSAASMTIYPNVGTDSDQVARNASWDFLEHWELPDLEYDIGLS